MIGLLGYLVPPHPAFSLLTFVESGVNADPRAGEKLLADFFREDTRRFKMGPDLDEGIRLLEGSGHVAPHRAEILQLPKEARHAAVGEDPAFRLAARAVGHFIGLEGDSCQNVAARKGTGFTEAAVHRESTTEA